MFFNNSNQNETIKIFNKIIDVGLNFKKQRNVFNKRGNIKYFLDRLSPLNLNGQKIDNIINEFTNKFLPYCTNFSSVNFMGFPDSGNSIAGISGAILGDLLQQNLINQNFCAPSATFIDIETIQRLREIVGYKNIKGISKIEQVGGIIVHGGTLSNTIAMLIAREHYYKTNIMKEGIYKKKKAYILIPKGIGHYSIRCSQMRLGLGYNIIEVETQNYKYDLNDLEKKNKKI